MSRDTLLWPIDRDLLLGLAPAGLSAAGMLLASHLYEGGGPEARELIALLVLAGHALLWLLFAPLYLLGWVHNHPRRDRDATGWTGSVALATLMWLLNILVYGALLAAFGRL